MGSYIEGRFLPEILQIIPIMANRISYLLEDNTHDLPKVRELLNIMANFMLIPTRIEKESDYQSLKLFQDLLNDLPFPELSELKSIINIMVAKIEAHTDFF